MATNPANDIQTCIQNCEQTVNKLNNMSEQSPNSNEKMMLREASHHLRLCIEECQYSVQELQNPSM